MKKIISFLFLWMLSTVQAQSPKIIVGDLKALKGLSEFNVSFDYANLKIHGSDSEEAYLDEKQRREKDPEKALKFREQWFSDRQTLYEPAFIAYFNARFPNGEIKVANNPEAKYTMNVKTTWIYLGYNQGVAIKPAKISATITVWETANPTNILVSFAYDKAVGLEHEVGAIFANKRMAWAYEKLAKNTTIQLKRFL